MGTTCKTIAATDRKDDRIKALVGGEESGDLQPFDSHRLKQETAAKHAEETR